jgi:hypothetical protein
MNLKPIIVGTMLGTLALLSCSNKPTSPNSSTNMSGLNTNNVNVPRVDVISATGVFDISGSGCAFLTSSDKNSYLLLFAKDKPIEIKNGELVDVVGEATSPTGTKCDLLGVPLLVQQISAVHLPSTQPAPISSPQL